MVYSQTQVANFDAPSRVVETTLASDYEPGEDFVVYIDDTTGGTNVKVDTTGGSTVTITSATEGSRLGGGTGIICKKIYSTGSTVSKVFALFG